MRDEDVLFMRRALDEAREALNRGDVPVGALLIGDDGRVLGRGSNIKTLDPTAHAEVTAL